jgi:hypothetical protein
MLAGDVQLACTASALFAAAEMCHARARRRIAGLIRVSTA